VVVYHHMIPANGVLTYRSIVWCVSRTC